MPEPQRWPRVGDHRGATFPPREKIPEAAQVAVGDFLTMRVRIADAERRIRDADRALTTAKDAENQGLVDHIRNGGSATTYPRPDTTAKQTALDHAKQEHRAFKTLIGEKYLTAMKALKKAASDGVALAEDDVTTTQAAYVEAIDAVERARRAYLHAIGLRYFWACLTERHQAMAGAGNGDQIVLRRGPVTRIDDHTFKAMRSDAQAHTRIDGTSEATNTW